MTCTVRPLETSDRERWLELFKAYLDYYDTDLPSEGIDRVWSWIFDEQNSFWAALAINGQGVPVGLAQYQLTHNTLTGSMTCYLADLYVDPSARGEGAGRTLVDHVRTFARSKGLPSVDWLTEETNKAARRLYDTYKPKTDYVFYSVPT